MDFKLTSNDNKMTKTQPFITIQKTNSLSYSSPKTKHSILHNKKDPELKSEKKLESWFELDLSKMGLRILCKEICYYNHITSLYLNNNKLTDISGEIFSRLKSLIILDLSYNLLTRLPSTIGYLVDLEKLIFHQNKISELPIELGQLYKIKELNLEGNPLTSPPQNILKGGYSIIIPYLRDRIPTGPPPPERRFISYIDPQITISEKERFRVLTYNILAQAYATSDQYFYCPSWALDWNYRKQGILKEISQYDCDIICLQEVETKQFNEFFLPEMEKIGYLGVFCPKSRARTMEDWGSVDGCAILFKMKKFNLLEKYIIEFQGICMSRHKDFVENSEAFSRLITKDNIAISVILQLKDHQSETDGSSPLKNSRGRTISKHKHILVSNTHIHWNPENKDVKLMQVQLLLEELSALSSPKSKWPNIPIIIAGDFNSTVDSGPYELLTKGNLKARHPDLDPYEYGVYSSYGMNHDLSISSSYAPIGEPQFTNFTDDFVGVLDYIWYSHDTLAVSKVLQPVDEETVRLTKLPNVYMHSDHVCLLSEFFLK